MEPKNKRGFTLIELLAVIVVLAIIALIAVPKVTKVINKAEKGAAERTAENYIDAVETAVAEERLSKNEVLEGEYQITSDGNLCRDKSASCSDDEKIKIEMSGTKPTSGTIKISNGQVTTDSTMTVGDYDISYKNKKLFAIDMDEISKQLSDKICVNVSGDTAYSYGAKYICELGDEEKRNFYVLEDGDTTTLTTGRQAQAGQVSLIMDRNLGERVAWDSNDSSTPETAKNYLKERTSGWTKLTAASGTASLPSAYQIAQSINILDLLQKYVSDDDNTLYRNDNNKLPNWLVGNLTPSPDSSAAPYAYWLLERSTSNSLYYPWCVMVPGTLSETGGMPYENASYGGIRPVITISKSQLG